MAATETKRVRRRLGEILVDAGVLTDDQVQSAVAEQQSSGRKLGEVLLESRLVTTAQLVRALAEQFGLEFIDLNERPLDVELAHQVSQALCRRHRGLPVYRRDGEVLVAMANPADVLALDDFRGAIRAPIRPVMAPPGQIMRAIDRMGHSDANLQQAIMAAVVDVEDPIEDLAPEPLAGVEESSPLVQFVDLLISRAGEERASDIHIEPMSEGLRVRYRVDGILREAMSPPKSLQASLISRIKVMANLDITERRIPQDGRISSAAFTGLDIRVATVPTVHGEAAVMRLLDTSADHHRIDDIGFIPDQLTRYRAAYGRPWGTVLVTGPTGSGKTTTLYATLRELNEPTTNIITVEDPVEYRLDGIKQVQVNTKAGLTFATALRSFLRADPDVMLVGEIRDRETATIAAEASLTGHLVLSTLHTNNAAMTPLRLLEMGVEPFMITSTVNAVLAQRLARRLCSACRTPVVIPPSVASGSRIPPQLLAEDGSFHAYQSGGCGRCSGSGYTGRVPVHEVMTMTEEIAELVLDRAPVEKVTGCAVEQGMTTLFRDGMHKVAQGITSVEEILRVIV
ncbi:MAG: Flp pilus assembly complex ATPase component [Actinomycetia bacterium]|nr:Flp pilus assembly complex ATPase component [Actinomycetes bacterium]